MNRHTVRLLPLVLMLASIGCGGPTRSLPEPRAVAVEPPAPPAPPAPVAPPPAVAVAPPSTKPGEPLRPPVPAEPAKPKRPLTVAEWTTEDVLAAYDEHDPALPQAVQHIVRVAMKAKDKEEVPIELLVCLLEANQPAAPPTPPKPPSNDEDAPPPRPAPVTLTVAGVVIPFFAGLEDVQARQAIIDILKGDLKTDLADAPCLELVLGSLVKNLTPYHEELLMSILLDPSCWRRDVEGMTPELLHQIGFKHMQPVASAALRVRLAHYIVQTTTPLTHRERIGPWLAGPEPINLGAQAVLHNSDLLSPEAKARFREAFAKLNSPALDRLLGITAGGTTGAVAAAPSVQPFQFTPSQPAPASNLFVSSDKGGLFSAASPPSEDEQSLELARLFWSPDFVASVARDVSRISDIGTQRELMLLASNLPQQAVRVELQRALQRQWIDGTAPFETAKLTLDNFRDPAFLVLVKSMPREEQKAPPATTGPAATPQPRPSKERQAKFAWMAAAESFVRSLNGRFYTAARAKPRGAQPVSYAKDADSTAATPSALPSVEMPIALHKGASVVAEYHLQWPAQLQPRLKDVPIDPLTLHYVRLEGEDRFTRVGDYYRRQVPGCAARTLARGQWLDSLQASTSKGQIRSVDVLITREDPPARTTANPPPENLIVEILWIEIPDPTR